MTLTIKVPDQQEGEALKFIIQEIPYLRGGNPPVSLTERTQKLLEVNQKLRFMRLENTLKKEDRQLNPGPPLQPDRTPLEPKCPSVGGDNQKCQYVQNKMTGKTALVPVPVTAVLCRD